MQGTLGRLVFGFIAAAIAVVIAHQGLIYALGLAGMLPPPVRVWSMAPVPPYGVPAIANSMFWGGLWGALYGLIHEKLPGGAVIVKGLIYGLLIVLFSNWLLVPLIKGNVFGQPNQVLFAGFVPVRMAISVLILSTFGMATALIYSLLRRD